MAGKRSTCECRYAVVGPIKVPDGVGDEQVPFLFDIFPTGYMAADFCNIQPGDTIARTSFRRPLPRVTMRVSAGGE